MGLFSGRGDAPDARPRELVLTGEPLVANEELVAIDLVVRFSPKSRPADTTIPVDAWRPSWVAEDERAIAAVVVTALRLLADQRTAADLLTDRASVVEVVDAALLVAPVAPLFEARTLRVEVSRHIPDLRDRQEFRVVG